MGEPVAQSSPSSSFSFIDSMGFSGFAPEVINGRLAMLGFLAGIGAESAQHETFAYQFSNHPVAFTFSALLITAASFMPAMQGETKYTPDPKSMGERGLFSQDAEMLNGRVAMLGMVAMLATEGVLGHTLL